MQLLTITSTISGEGKTFVSMNLAITLSTLGKKVVLVGADLRNPQLHKMLNIVRLKKGVTNFLHDTAASYDDLIDSASTLPTLIPNAVRTFVGSNTAEVKLYSTENSFNIQCYPNPVKDILSVENDLNTVSKLTISDIKNDFVGLPS